jgi:radical SAM protein with 4Fe4S-binding SPASM domain
MYDSSTYWSEMNRGLDFDSCTNVIDDFVLTANRWGLIPQINFTGGDPLLRADFWGLLDYSVALGVAPGLLGNPYHVTKEIARKLKKYGVRFYQISIDGMEQTHDAWRRPGSFMDSLRALRVLREEGVETHVMFTLSKQNAGELMDVIHLVAEEEVDAFTFDLMVPTGKASRLKEENLTPYELRALLVEVDELWRELRTKGVHTCWFRKLVFWKLLAFEQGKLNPSILNWANVNRMTIGGCVIGGPYLTLLADGTVLPCRRLPIPVGKLPEDSISAIMVNSQLLRRLRDPENYEQCRLCILKTTCRGCPAITYTWTGNPFAQNPYCWETCGREVGDE